MTLDLEIIEMAGGRRRCGDERGYVMTRHLIELLFLQEKHTSVRFIASFHRFVDTF